MEDYLKDHLPENGERLVNIEFSLILPKMEEQPFVWQGSRQNSLENARQHANKRLVAEMLDGPPNWSRLRPIVNSVMVNWMEMKKLFNIFLRNYGTYLRNNT